MPVKYWTMNFLLFYFRWGVWGGGGGEGKAMLEGALEQLINNPCSMEILEQKGTSICSRVFLKQLTTTGLTGAHIKLSCVG